MEGNEIENLAIRIKQQIAEKIDDYASIQSEPLRKEIERLNAELTRANARIEELQTKLKQFIPKECVHGWDEVKFCPARLGDGGECIHCL